MAFRRGEDDPQRRDAYRRLGMPFPGGDQEQPYPGGMKIGRESPRKIKKNCCCCGVTGCLMVLFLLGAFCFIMTRDPAQIENAMEDFFVQYWPENSSVTTTVRLKLKMPKPGYGLTENESFRTREVILSRLPGRWRRSASAYHTGGGYVEVVIHGKMDHALLKSRLGRMGLLEILHTGGESLGVNRSPAVASDARKCEEEYGAGDKCLLFNNADVEGVKLKKGIGGDMAIVLSLKKNAAETFAKYTGSHVNQYYAITMDGVVISSQVVKTANAGRYIRISGISDERYAEDIVVILNSGMLPAPVESIGFE